MNISNRIKSTFLLFILIGISACSTESDKMENIKMVAKENSQLLGQLIEYSEVQPYFHPEVAGRKPLIIKVSDTVKVSGNLEKFGSPVIITTDKPVVDAFLEVEELKHLDDRIEFKVRYDVEGLLIKGSYQKGDAGSFKKIEVIEN